jgi:hypothetical protein
VLAPAARKSPAGSVRDTKSNSLISLRGGSDRWWCPRRAAATWLWHRTRNSHYDVTSTCIVQPANAEVSPLGVAGSSAACALTIIFTGSWRFRTLRRPSRYMSRQKTAKIPSAIQRRRCLLFRWLPDYPRLGDHLLVATKKTLSNCSGSVIGVCRSSVLAIRTWLHPASCSAVTTTGAGNRVGVRNSSNLSQ